MPDEGAGSQGSLPLGDGGQAGSATVDWSKGGAEHFGPFKESLGDLGKDKSFEPIKDFKGLASSFVNAQKMIGGSIQLPKDGTKPEERKQAIDGILQKLRTAGILEAIPESPDKYEIKMPQSDVDGHPFQTNEPLVKSFKDAIHKLKVPPSTAQGLFDWYLNFQAESEAANDAAFENMKVGLKKEWGGLHIRRMEAAKRAAFKYLGEDSEAMLTDPRVPVDYSLKILKAFAQIGDPLLEDDIVTGNLVGMPSADDIEKKMQIMMSDPKGPLMDLSHPMHKQALKEYSELNDQYSQLKARK